MFLFVALKGGSKILDIFLKAFAIKGVGQVFLGLKTLSSCLFIGPESDHWLCLSLTN